MHQYKTKSCSLGPNDRSLNNTGGGYHLKATNLKTYLSPTFPSVFSTSPLFALLGLILNHSIN
jgi:hypothetical protein